MFRSVVEPSKGLIGLIDVAMVLTRPVCCHNALVLTYPQAAAGWREDSATTGFFIQTIKQVPRGTLGEATFVCSG